MTGIIFALLLGVICISLSSSQSFTKQPQSVLGFKRLQALFECQVSGLTNPVYYWKKNGVNATRGKTEIRDSVVVLSITRLKFSDSGSYVCVAVGTTTTLISTAATLTVQGSPDIIQGPRALSPHVGQTVEFLCDTIGNPTPVINWTNPSNQPITNGVRFSVYANGTLVISSLQKSDKGYYTCASSNNFGSTSAFAELTVFDAPAPPTFTTTLANQTAREGTDVTFYCAATGVPTPSITWDRLAGVIPNDRNNEPRPGALRIKNVLPSDDGIYVCNATNSQGMKQALVHLTIEGYPRFVVSPMDITVVEYVSVALHCIVTADPTPSIKWTLPSSEEVTSASSPVRGVQVLANNTLVIGNVTESHHGQYICVASNPVGERMKKAMVSVLTIPRFNSALPNITKSISGNIKITCPSRGNPAPQHQWIFGGKILSMLQTLTLMSLNVSNQGYYTCQLNNSHGVVEEKFYLRVMVPPKIVRPPTNQTVPLSSTVSLGCQTTGDPPPVITWENSRGSAAGQLRYSVAANGTLTITMATQSDMGWLTCRATNGAGMVTRKAYLIISDLPVFIQLPSNQTLVKGNAITLRCRATGADTPVITWFKADQSGELQKVTSSEVTLVNGDLQFASVIRQDKGQYACQACNIAGCKMAARILLNVLYNPLFPVPPPNVGVLRGQAAKLKCEPDSNPQATITWTRPDGTLMAGTGYEQIIPDVAPEHTGVYKCSARNTFGTTGEQSIKLSIQTQAEITNITKQATSTDLVTCDVTGDPAPKITWYLDNVTLPENALYPDYSVTRDSKLSVPIGALENNTFLCHASNPHAVAIYLVKVSVPPTNVTFTSVTTHSAVVTWARPSPPTYLVKDYELDMWSAVTSWRSLSNSTGNTLSYPVSNLIPFTAYRFRVRAVNGLGTSASSLESENITTLSSEPSIPRNLRLDVLNASVIKVTWYVPERLNGPLGDLQYHVTYLPKVPNATTSNEFELANDKRIRPQELVIAGLVPDTVYNVKVKAGRRRAEDGEELWSDAVDGSARTRQLVPQTFPFALKITSNGASQIMVQWKRPPYSISGYYIWYKVHKSGQTYTKVHISDASAHSYVIMNLEENTPYDVRIQMYSNSGIGPLSLAQVVTTEVDAFGADYSKKDKGSNWIIAVVGVVCGVILLAIVIGVVWYRKRRSIEHRQSFRISATRSRPSDYLVRGRLPGDSREGSIGGIHNDALDADVDLNMFEHGIHDATTDHGDRQVEYMDPTQLEFGYNMMHEVPVASGDQDVHLESYSPRDIEGHYDEVECSAPAEFQRDTAPDQNGLPRGTFNGIPVYSQVDKTSKKNRKSSNDSEQDPVTTWNFENMSPDIPDKAPAYHSIDHTVVEDTENNQENAPSQESPQESPLQYPRSENFTDNEPLSEPLNFNDPTQQNIDIPPFPERKNTTASEVSIEFPPPPPIDTLPAEEQEQLQNMGMFDSESSDPPSPTGPQGPVKPPRTFQEYQNNVPSTEPPYNKEPNMNGVPSTEPPSDNGPRKRRMVADWGDEGPVDNLWEQLDKELDMRLGT